MAGTRPENASAVILRNRSEVLTAGPGQFFAYSNDGRTLGLWEAAPPELRARFPAPVLIDQWPTADVLYLFTDKEAELLWNGGAFRTIFSAGDRMHVAVFQDGTRVEVAPSQFLQTDRTQTRMQLWQLKRDAPPVRDGYWYDTRGSDADLVREWSVDSLRLVLSDQVIEQARLHGLLRSILAGR